MVKKISIFIIILTLILAIIPIKTYATGSGSIFDSIINPDLYSPGKEESPEAMEIANLITGIIYYAGIFISVGALMIIGIKYMLGSVEEKAQYKEVMMPYIIGAVLLFGGVNILKIIETVVKQIIKT